MSRFLDGFEPGQPVVVEASSDTVNGTPINYWLRYENNSVEDGGEEHTILLEFAYDGGYPGGDCGITDASLLAVLKDRLSRARAVNGAALAHVSAALDALKG